MDCGLCKRAYKRGRRERETTKGNHIQTEKLTTIKEPPETAKENEIDKRQNVPEGPPDLRHVLSLFSHSPHGFGRLFNYHPLFLFV